MSIKSIKVKGKAFTPTLEREGTPGTYCYYVSRTRKNVYIYNYDITDITLTMSIILNFNENNGESVVAY
ncbi:MAG: hypothetical protein MJ200_03210 [Mycoplasmoidaceae bacterium]|nr:hypothetical protein [Mycoplasmoidaceae bacterium]